MYVLDCWKAFRNLEMDLACVVALEVKKLFTGLLLWKARDGTVLKADREAMEMVEVSLKGCRIVKAMAREML
jgi:hypothetical protein